MRGIAIAALLLLAACGRNSMPAPSRTTPVILISVDTLRSDHLPSYGYRGVETPHLDAFRKDAVLFEHAYSHVPLTLPSHTSILTGLLPGQHGIRDNTGFALKPNVQTIAAAMKANGYATGAAVSTFVLRRETGIERGFDFYDDHVEFDPASVSRSQRSGALTIPIAQRWIEEHRGGPFFFFLHLYEPHAPYEPPEPYKSRYASIPYDGEIAYTDDLVGGFLQFLKDQHLYDDALIIFLSDHGEGLGEHGEDEHGIFLYREAIQVPLMVKLPKNRRAGSTISAPAELIDVAPTIAEETKTAFAAHNGASLLHLIDGTHSETRSVYSETYYPRFHFGWSDLHSMIDGQRHYIEAPSPELYDLTTDFDEKTNVINDQRRAYNAFRREMEPLKAAMTAPSPVDPDTLQKLQSLGYIGSTVATKPGEVLPDPKSRVPTLKHVRDAILLFKDGRYAEAHAVFQPALAENPGMPEIWTYDAKALEKLGRYDEALEAARHSFELQPKNGAAALDVAEIATAAGKFDVAEKHAELAMTDFPTRAHEMLAGIALARGDVPTAVRDANASLQTRESISGLIILGRAEWAGRQYAAALQHLDRVRALLQQAKEVPPVTVDFIRGDCLGRLGRDAEAEQAFRSEIANYPSNVEAWQNLVVLYVSEGRNDDARRTIDTLIRTVPRPEAYAAVARALHVIGDEHGAQQWVARGLELFPGNPLLKRMKG